MLVDIMAALEPSKSSLTPARRRRPYTSHDASSPTFPSPDASHCPRSLGRMRLVSASLATAQWKGPSSSPSRVISCRTFRFEILRRRFPSSRRRTLSLPLCSPPFFGWTCCSLSLRGMSTSLRLADLGRPPRVRIQNSDGDPLASGLAQVCDVAEALLQAQHRKLRKEGDRQTGERYRRRGEVVDAWRKKVMTRRDEHPLVVPLADLVANLQVAANKIWATPITEKLELVRRHILSTGTSSSNNDNFRQPDQRHVCQVYLVVRAPCRRHSASADPLHSLNQPHTEYLSPTCKLADFAPAPELVDDDMEESRRAQTSDARIRAATDYEARIRTATNYCYKYVVQTAQQAGAANLLSACLARKEDYAVWRGHVVRWSRVEEQALTDHRAMHNLRSLSDKLWTTPLTEQIRFVS